MATTKHAQRATEELSRYVREIVGIYMILVGYIPINIYHILHYDALDL